ncbi:hypothetical protein K502DRAFT_342459 [Neoconidiobolus thromboides FSU 785]|nr:hypothetical protein K502DRAFT_342459 [Neoconidiobolus thromboides FSU 785]
MSNFIRHLLKSNNIATYQFIRRDKNLFELLSVQPNNGVGLRVAAKEWLNKGKDNLYYTITKSQIKKDLKHGKAWGELYVNGKLVPNKRIRHGLKLNWLLHPGPQPALEANKVSKETESKME